jgi:hypothetical protein
MFLGLAAYVHICMAKRCVKFQWSMTGTLPCSFFTRITHKTLAT